MQRAKRRCGPGGHRKVMRETNSPRRQPIDIGGRQPRIAIGMNPVGLELISQNKNYGRASLVLRKPRQLCRACS